MCYNGFSGAIPLTYYPKLCFAGKPPNPGLASFIAQTRYLLFSGIKKQESDPIAETGYLSNGVASVAEITPIAHAADLLNVTLPI